MSGFRRDSNVRFWRIAAAPAEGTHLTAINHRDQLPVGEAIARRWGEPSEALR
jgi:hypothetical protein